MHRSVVLFALALAMPDAVEALLGVETGGMAPAAGSTRAVLTATGEVAARVRSESTSAARTYDLHPARGPS